MAHRTRFLIIALLLTLVCGHVGGGEALASDRSFSNLVKHIEKNYSGRRQSFYGAVSFGRLLVKLIRPAGFKNFKVVALRELDFGDNPTDTDFARFVGEAVDKQWSPLFRYVSRRHRQWTHAYVQESGDNVKILVATVQKQEAFVVQFKFEPQKLVQFLDEPRILGISLRGKEKEGEPNSQPNSGTR